MIDKAPTGVRESIDGLTGFDEVEIEKRFGAHIDDLLETRPLRGGRALAHIHILRDLTAADVKDPGGKAYKRVMEMTQTQVNEFFDIGEAEEVNEDEPVTESGKDDESPA